MVLGYAGARGKESGQLGKMTKKKPNKRRRPAKTAEAKKIDQSDNVWLLLVELGLDWANENHKKFRTPSGRKELLAEAERLRDESKRAKRKEESARKESNRGVKVGPCLIKFHRSNSMLQAARADAIEIIVNHSERDYPEIAASLLLDELLAFAVKLKKKDSKKWRRRFQDELPGYYGKLIKEKDYAQWLHDEDAAAFGDGPCYEDSIRIFDLNTRRSLSAINFTLKDTLVQFLKDYTGHGFTTRHIERRLEELGLTDKK